MELQPVALEDVDEFRSMAEAYWAEIMPTAGTIQTAEQRAAYFAETFSFESGKAPVWALVGEERVGFAHYTHDSAARCAFIEDFYVAPARRRTGLGAAMLRALYAQLDRQGVERVELFVRRDAPHALAFWEAQGFRIASYRLRQYRDPATGRAWIGALSSDFDRES